MMLERALTRVLREPVTPVTILEGARAVGKTVLARSLVENGTYQGYVNLADPNTLGIARADLPGWLRSLPDSVVIDEAQLLDTLPLYVKFLVDEPGTKRRFLLTGSASLGRTGLGGSDPLTGRAIRHRLWPLTGAELSRRPESMETLTRELFDGTFRDRSPLVAPAVEASVALGGFAPVSLGDLTQPQADSWVRSTVVGLLTDNVLPDERFDAGVALRVLDGCFRNPGGVLNVASLGQRLGLDPRTVDRYLDVLERRFLLTFLPNLATSAVRQARSRSKAHPLDSAFCLESIRRGNPDGASSTEASGAVLESWVVNQVLPCLALGSTPVSAMYWRDSKMKSTVKNEVDLVLIDGAERAVGIEVKRATSVGPSDAAGLVELDQRRGLSFGYVLYAGNEIIRLADRIYAVPISALS